MYRDLIILLVLIILAAAAFFIAERALAPTPEDAVVGSDREDSEDGPEEVSGDAEAFKRELEGAVVAEIGQPIEGFVPSMFLEVYPELQPADFNDVDALIGMYVYEDGELRHELDGAQPVHSAAEAISPEGYETLYVNISTRIGVTAGPDAVIDAIEGDEDEVVEGDAQRPTANEVVCTEAMKQADFCTQEYAPVCGLVEVQCVSEPCDPVPETFSNGCTACSQGNVISYTPGACEAS